MYFTPGLRYSELILADPEGAAPTSWILSGAPLAAASPALLDTLDAAAKAGNKAAAVTLCKAALAKKNPEMLERNWAHLADERAARAEQVWRAPRAEDLALACRGATEQEKAQICLSFLANSRHLALAQLVGLVELVVEESSLTLADLPAATLTSLTKSTAYREQARALLESRKS